MSERRSSADESHSTVAAAWSSTALAAPSCSLEPVRPMSRSRHIPALDGLRGIAVLLVVSWHALRAPHAGALGVDLFFVLSGFLITSLLISEWRRSGSISLRAFYRRRALRLLPAL